jgi:head-tail adaptor
MEPGLLNETVTHKRAVNVSNGHGGWKKEHAPVGSRRARIRQASAKEKLAAEQLQGELSHVAYFQPGEPLQRGDRLRRADGTEVEVLTVYAPTGPGGHVEAKCMEIVLQPAPGESVTPAGAP